MYEGRKFALVLSNFQACARGDMLMTLLLLENKADGNVKDKVGRSWTFLLTDRTSGGR